MPQKQDLRTLLSEQLGQKTADAILAKVNSMAKRGAGAAQIEKVFLTEVTRAVEKRVSRLVGTPLNAVGLFRATITAVHPRK